MNTNLRTPKYTVLIAYSGTRVQRFILLAWISKFRIRLELEGGTTFNETSLVKLSTIDRILFYMIDFAL